MNILQRLLNRQHFTAYKEDNSQKITVSYEASISFSTDFLVHFYDETKTPFLLEKKGGFFQMVQHLPQQRKNAYFRIYVFNPRGLENETVRVKIKVMDQVVTEKVFLIPGNNTFIQWFSVRASLS